MSHEIEAAAGEAMGGVLGIRRRGEHAPTPGALCANCGAPLQGPFCHQCGQLAEDYHRSIWKLVAEAFEGLFHVDSRLWVTLPGLFRHPARLTRAYLDGHRAPQAPPFRLFLVVLVGVFLAGSLGHRQSFKPATISFDENGHTITTRTRTLDQLSLAERENVKAEIQKAHLGFGGDWLKVRMARVLDDPRRFWMVMESWAERFAFLTLPMAILLLSLAFVFQRRFYLFDHAIFSLHSLSAVGLLFTATELLGAVVGSGAAVILWAAPIHLFAHMRGVYQTSVIGTLARMAFLFLGTIIIGTFIMLGLVLVGLSGMES
ncbi:MAG TPA: DUF3667 domain-containing protein [Caulobacteraceae bacterium]|nr:DUF3667 domain-containing protein [Caulobacteraceae bacterium]